MARGTCELAVSAAERHRGVPAIIVIELERAPGRRPRTRVVTALAREHVAALERVRLLLVARPAQAIGREERAVTAWRLRGMTALAARACVLPLERPAREGVIES